MFLKRVLRAGFLTAILDFLLLALLVVDVGGTRLPFSWKTEIGLFLTLTISLLGVHLYVFSIKMKGENGRKQAMNSLIVLSVGMLVEMVLVYLNFDRSFLDAFLETKYVFAYMLFVYLLVRLTYFVRFVYSHYFNPALLFVGSFAIVILVGSFLLMLPDAATRPIAYTDALFTATSAVCVTGLVTLNMAQDFTLFGQTIIIGLIQIGGLGLLTITTFFAYFFKTGSSYKEGLFISEIFGDKQLNNIMRLAVQIVLFSIIIELVGAILIYNSTRNLELEHPLFFSVFHSISSFCNAGFSTLPENLATPTVRSNYAMQWIIMGLITFGGLGYFISFNFLKYIKQIFVNIFSSTNHKATRRLITLNTKIVTYTTLIIIVGGALIILGTEYNTVLTEDISSFGKFTTAMFSVVTARTCGFSTVDYGAFTIPGILIIVFIMWVGASPASTGGGIKTSSIAIAFLNIFSTARNKPYIQIGTRRIANEAVQRSYSIIILALMANGIGILLLSSLEDDFSFLAIVFESFSAFSTTGLSMGITPQLSTAGKYVLIALMFFGRIGLINLMTGLLRSLKPQDYEYPEENILIN